ncbi:MICAL-like protein 1 [Aplochiton taeniatus]
MIPYLFHFSDFDSLSQENVYENNRLAFEVAETELGIPALLDPEDMVSMKVPDRLSIITYVSQYYNYFTNKSYANPPCMKRPSGTGHSEPALKRPVAPLENIVVDPERSAPDQSAVEGGVDTKRSTLSSTCAACQKHVHLVQRFLVDSKLYHRNCFRCQVCSSTLLPGSYKLGNNTDSLVCTHHFARPALANQNGRPDLSKRPGGVPSTKSVITTPPPTPPSKRDLTPPLVNVASAPAEAIDPPDEGTGKTDSVKEKDQDTNGGHEVKPAPTSPFNPFDESDKEEEGLLEEETPAPVKEETTNGSLPAPPVSHPAGASRPVPAPRPRRLPEPAPPPRPVPRVRPPRVTDSSAVNGDHWRPVPTPKPRDRSHSPGSSSLSSDPPKAKDPPWLALVHSEPKKKTAPPPPTVGLATPPNAGSLSSLKEEGSRPATPAKPPNPFDEEEEEEEEEDDNGEVVEEVGASVPDPVVASHPWYRITQAAEAGASDASPSGGRLSRSPSPGSSRNHKRPAPRAPQTANANSALPHSQPSSSSPSPAISMESLSSASDHSSSHPPTGGGAVSDQEHPFIKSVSEPFIGGPGDSPCSSSTNGLPSLSPSANTSSAPATPQTNRSSRPPPPRPPSTASPLTSSGAPAPPGPPSQGKRTCKENPFNRKASPSGPSPKTRPPRGPRPARPPAPGHGFPLIKRKVQSDQYIPVEDIHVEMGELEKQLDELEQRGVELEKKLRDNPNDEEEEHLLVDWFTLIHEKHLLVRREAELVYTAKQQNLEERQADVEYELRCLLNKPEKDWSEDDKSRDQELMAELVTIIEQRNQIINNMDQDRQRDEEEDMLLAAMLKKKDFQKDPESEQQQQQQQQQQKKKGGKFKPMKVLKRLSNKGEPGKSRSPQKDKS